MRNNYNKPLSLIDKEKIQQFISDENSLSEDIYRIIIDNNLNDVDFDYSANDDVSVIDEDKNFWEFLFSSEKHLKLFLEVAEKSPAHIELKVLSISFNKNKQTLLPNYLLNVGADNLSLYQNIFLSIYSHNVSFSAQDILNFYSDKVSVEYKKKVDSFFENLVEQSTNEDDSDLLVKGFKSLYEDSLINLSYKNYVYLLFSVAHYEETVQKNSSLLCSSERSVNIITKISKVVEFDDRLREDLISMFSKSININKFFISYILNGATNAVSKLAVMYTKNDKYLKNNIKAMIEVEKSVLNKQIVKEIDTQLKVGVRNKLNKI